MILPNEDLRVNWRDGVATRLHAQGTTALGVLGQRSAPGAAAPTHTHFDTEEVIIAFDGVAEVWVDGVAGRLDAGDSIVLPPCRWRGFQNAGSAEFQTAAIFGSPLPLAEYTENPAVVLEIGRADVRMGDCRSFRDAGTG